MIDLNLRTMLFAMAVGFAVLAVLFRRSARRKREPNLEVGWFADTDFEVLSALCLFFAFAAVLTGARPLAGPPPENMAPKAQVFSRSPKCAQAADAASLGVNLSGACPAGLEKAFPKIGGGD